MRIAVVGALLLAPACGDAVATAETGTTGTSTGAAVPTTSGVSASDTGPMATETGMAATTSEGSSSDTGAQPDGCGDGVPEIDVACFVRVEIPEVRGAERVVADFDGDGAIDLALEQGDLVRIAFGNGAGGFAVVQEVPLGAIITYVDRFTPADVDGDADVDLQLASSDRVFVLINDGFGTFEVDLVAPSPAPYLEVFVDATADGVPELVANSYSVDPPNAPELRVHRREGAVFVKQPWAGPFPGCYGSALARIDFNQDAFEDVLVASSCNDPKPLSPVNLFLGTGQASFTQTVSAIVGSDPVVIAVSDFDGDGREDFATANQFGDDISVVLRDDEGFAAEIRVGGICEGCGSPNTLVAGDFDGNGVADELVVHFGAPAPGFPDHLIMNPVAGGPLVTFELAAHGSRLLAVADLNGDGVDDIATTGDQLALVLFLSDP